MKISLNRSFVIIVVVLLTIGVILFIKCRNYRVKKEVYSTSIWLDFQRVYNNFISDKGSYPKTKKDFEQYIQHSDMFYDFEYYLDKEKYNFMIADDTIYFYFFGFDNNDDNCKKIYNLRDVDFIKSLFIDGDIVFFKQQIYINKDNDR